MTESLIFNWSLKTLCSQSKDESLDDFQLCFDSLVDAMNLSWTNKTASSHLLTEWH